LFESVAFLLLTVNYDREHTIFHSHFIDGESLIIQKRSWNYMPHTIFHSHFL